MANQTLQQAFDLALEHHQAGRLTEAEAGYRQILALEPNQPETLHYLGVLLHQVGRTEDALKLIGQALVLRPNYAEARSNQGEILRAQGQLEAAMESFKQASELDPQFALAHYNQGIALQNQGKLDEALVKFQQTISLQPNMAEAYKSLGNAYSSKGQLEKFFTAIRKALTLEQADSTFYSNLLFVMQYAHDYDNAAIAEELSRWNKQHCIPLRSTIQPHPNDRSPNRRLRVGYLSPDLRDHPVGRFLLPLLEHHNRQQYEIFAYAQVESPDELTERLRANADTWRNTIGLSDDKVAELIRSDQIDILVDLAMHTANNRLLVFARKPAPIQVNYLAYVGSSGLTTMDYRLSDPYLDPPGMDESIYCEQTVRLPETYWCYQPIDVDLPPAAARPPQHAIRFGCLNNFCKLNLPLVKLWAQILRAVPESQLLIHAFEGDHRPQMLDQFAQLGIDPSRVEFVGRMARKEYFQTYQTLDITLDTTPYAGGTTTCDSLWMGVPVVTLVGERAVGRGGVSILSNLGLPELIAKTPEEYIEIAVALAQDKARLQNLRHTLRQRMQASPLMDAPKFARNVEDAYRTIWHKWVAS